MKRLFLAIAVASIIAAANVPAADQFDEDGNYKRADEMQAAWCKYNEGRDFITDQCD